MTIFGLSSPEILVLLIILLFILGPKRIEKLITSFPGFIKFLLNDEKNYKVIREEKEVEAPVLEEKEVEAPVLEEKEVEAPVFKEKELESSKNEDKSTKIMKGISINSEGEKKVNRKRSVKTKEKTAKKEKTPKPNKKTQIKKDKEPNIIK